MGKKLTTLLNNLRVSFKKKIPIINKHGSTYKGSGYQGKGSVNTDAATFNKTRKE
jgi:hypothetical protein